jgi:aspartyl-tRNA(Asn)/glutamyl-tRNA(Gln) amidotransferase subunit C
MISKEEVQNLAALARLELGDGEVESLQKDISNILEYVGQLSSASVGGDGENIKVAGIVHNVLREDVPRQAGDPMAGKEEKIKEAFPKREGEYNVVRKIIQKDE